MWISWWMTGLRICQLLHVFSSSFCTLFLAFQPWFIACFGGPEDSFPCPYIVPPPRNGKYKERKVIYLGLEISRLFWGFTIELFIAARRYIRRCQWSVYYSRANPLHVAEVEILQEFGRQSNRHKYSARSSVVYKSRNAPELTKSGFLIPPTVVERNPETETPYWPYW